MPDRAAFKFWISLHKAAIKGREPGISPYHIERDPRLLWRKIEEKEN